MGDEKKLESALAALVSTVYREQQPRVRKTTEKLVLESTLSDHSLLLHCLGDRKIPYQHSPIEKIVSRTGELVYLPIISDFRKQWSDYRALVYAHNSQHLKNTAGFNEGDFMRTMKATTFANICSSQYWKRCSPSDALRFPLLMADEFLPLGSYYSPSEERARRARYLATAPKTVVAVMPPEAPLTGPKLADVARWVSSWVSACRVHASGRIIQGATLAALTLGKQVDQGIAIAMNDIDSLASRRAAAAASGGGNRFVSAEVESDLRAYHASLGVPSWETEATKDLQTMLDELTERITRGGVGGGGGDDAKRQANLKDELVEEKKTVAAAEQSTLADLEGICDDLVTAAATNGAGLFRMIPMCERIADAARESLSRVDTICEDFGKMPVLSEVGAVLRMRLQKPLRIHAQKSAERLKTMQDEIAAIRNSELALHRRVSVAIATLVSARSARMLIDAMINVITDGTRRLGSAEEMLRETLLAMVRATATTPMGFSVTMQRDEVRQITWRFSNVMYSQAVASMAVRVSTGLAVAEAGILRTITVLRARNKRIDTTNSASVRAFTALSGTWGTWPVYPEAREPFLFMAGSMQPRMARLNQELPIMGGWTAPSQPLRTVDADDPIDFAGWLEKLQAFCEAVHAQDLLQGAKP